jgi:hypothetical protein
LWSSYYTRLIRQTSEIDAIFCKLPSLLLIVLINQSKTPNHCPGGYHPIAPISLPFLSHF